MTIYFHLIAELVFNRKIFEAYQVSIKHARVVMNGEIYQCTNNDESFHWIQQQKVVPWFCFLKLLDLALNRLPIVRSCVWRTRCHVIIQRSPKSNTNQTSIPQNQILKTCIGFGACLVLIIMIVLIRSGNVNRSSHHQRYCKILKVIAEIPLCLTMKKNH